MNPLIADVTLFMPPAVIKRVSLFWRQIVKTFHLAYWNLVFIIYPLGTSILEQKEVFETLIETKIILSKHACGYGTKLQQKLGLIAVLMIQTEFFCWANET